MDCENGETRRANPRPNRGDRFQTRCTGTVPQPKPQGGACEQVVIAGPGPSSSGTCSSYPHSESIKAADGQVHSDIPMWLVTAEGTLGVDDFLKTDSGDMPPVIHVDSTAPLHSTTDGSLDRRDVGNLLQTRLPFRRRSGWCSTFR